MVTDRNVGVLTIVTCLFCIFITCKTDRVSVRIDDLSTKFYIKEGLKFGQIAWAKFEDTTNQTGWSFLEVYSNSSYSDMHQAYAAGLAEGAVTRSVITLSWHNTMAGFCEQTSAYCQHLKTYLQANFEWIQTKIEKNPKNSYWHQVALFLTQMNGLQDGFYNQPGAHFTYKVANVFSLGVLMQITGDLEDLESALQPGKSHDTSKLGFGRCSALVKLLSDSSDLYVAQDTWTTYQSMLRILKKYDLKFQENLEGGSLPGHTMTFSSSPGSLTSGDDYYTISSKMVTMETTIGNGNADLWKYVKPTDSLPEGIRSMVANRLARNGQDWVNIFSMYNSGTYNNQWMVIDYKMFEPGTTPTNGLLYVLEQIPGYIEHQDLTSVLTSQGYWPSYNTAYFPKIFNMSGGPDMVKKYGSWFTYEHTARANIFRRDHSKVMDLSSMTKLMRYNDFQHDPLSSCKCDPPYSGENAISARSDLNPANGTYPFSALEHRNHGGIDMKLTNSKMMGSLEFISVAGPTSDNQPPFRWSTADFGNSTRHLGHPDLFLFKPIQHKWGSR